MKRISTLISFITIILLSSCSNHPQPNALTGASGNKMAKPADADYQLVANRPSMKSADADANWVATSNPNAAVTPRMARMSAVALSAATTVEGHDILKKEVEKAMRTSQAKAKREKPKTGKAPAQRKAGLSL
ncbi:hypothetical protein [Pontibacter roseus]|uniref:hypothetical protein n=1 Tax=Pontibacter roseus TaxID=336989 RepID=UPI00035FB3B6|nr:hypothetical protein [Pontibacter roseus]